MRRAAIGLVLLSCSAPAAERRPPEALPHASAQARAQPAMGHPTPAKDCLVVGDERAEVALDGTLRRTEAGMVLRLAEPRCAVGLPHASVLTEVVVVSDGFDLRPLAGARIRAAGRVLGDAGALEGPAVVVLVRSVERLPPRDEP